MDYFLKLEAQFEAQRLLTFQNEMLKHLDGS